MYARGATPARPGVVGWSPPAGASVPALPAATPATCVPWNDTLGSTARRLRASVFAPTNERATITFGVVHFVPPFGNPAGYWSPAGEKNRLVWSTPSSTMAILIPSPDPPP